MSNDGVLDANKAAMEAGAKEFQGVAFEFTKAGDLPEPLTPGEDPVLVSANSKLVAKRTEYLAALKEITEGIEGGAANMLFASKAMTKTDITAGEKLLDAVTADDNAWVRMARRADGT